MLHACIHNDVSRRLSFIHSWRRVVGGAMLNTLPVVDRVVRRMLTLTSPISSEMQSRPFAALNSAG